MIVPPTSVRVLVATKPVDFRKGMDGLAAFVQEELKADPFSGIIYVFLLPRLRPKYVCRSCTDGVVQAPAPHRLIPGGLPTEALVADVFEAKYANHLPLYGQAQIFAREGVQLNRSTLAHRVGFAAAELEPLHARLVEILKSSPKLFADETTCPVLDPGRAYQDGQSVGHRPR